MRRVWKKFIQKYRGIFSTELKFKTDFPVRTGFSFAHPIYFIIYLNGYLTTLFSLKVSKVGTGQYLCAYYVMENIHGLVGAQTAYT